MKARTIFALALLVAIFAGCKKDFLDVNVDPNNPALADLNQLLPLTQINIANTLGNGGSGLSDPLSVFVHQTNQRSNADAYGITSNDFALTQSWNYLYTGALINLDQIIRIGTEKENFPYVGIAQIEKAYAYSMMVDVWGDIPFSEALQAPKIPYPKWDKGKDVYPQLFTMIDEGIANLKKTAKSGVLPPGSDDLIYGGNVSKWIRFANTLKLKMYNQVRLVQDVKAPVTALLGTDNGVSAFLSGIGDDFQLVYGTSGAPENRHPAFIQEYTSANKVDYISPYFYEILTNKSTLNPVLNGIKDPRVPYYFYNQLKSTASAQNPTEYRDGGFISIYFASTGVNQGFDQSTSQTTLGIYPAGGKYDIGDGKAVSATSGLGNAPQRLLTYYSYLYTRAELALTLGVGGDAKDFFEKGMRASFAKVNQIASTGSAPAITADAIDAYVNAVLAKYDAADANKLELILTEKWIASFGFAVDSYTDYRRTGYPKMLDVNNDGISYTNTTRNYPVSLPYRLQDIQTNPNNPGQRSITTDKVFWQP